MVEIDEKDLLQANATIIAGVLILLTLLASVTDIFKTATKLIMAIAILPFITSIFVLIMKDFGRLMLTERKRFEYAKRITALGSIYLMGAIIVLIIAS